MTELDVETLKRLEKSEDCVEVAAEVQPMLPAIIAALEDRDRLHRILYGKDGVYAVLRLECAEVDANDWPDDLHPSDVIEKHLARTYAAKLRAALEDRDRLRAALERLVDEIERKRPLDMAFGAEWANGIHKAQDAGRGALEGRDG